MKILVINQYFSPDIASTGQLAADICNYLSENDFEVFVITGQPSYTNSVKDAPSQEHKGKLHIFRVNMGRWKGREKLFLRIMGYLKFLWGAFQKARKLTRKYKFDVILTFHNPPFVSLLGAWFSQRKQLKFIFAFYDIHPDILIKSGWRIPRLFVWLWNKINKYVFKRAESIVVLGKRMKLTLVEEKRVAPHKVKIIPIWGRPEFNFLPKEKDELIRKELEIGEEDLVFLYAGNMGVMHPLEHIIKAAKMLRKKPVRFIFVGDGVKKKKILSEANSAGLSKVHFLPFQPKNKFIKILSASDICFVVLADGFEKYALPSKAFTFLSAGRPLITIMSPDADIAQLVEEEKCGWNVTDYKELAELILFLLTHQEEIKIRGQNAYRVYRKNFMKDKIIKKYAQLLTSKQSD